MKRSIKWFGIMAAVWVCLPVAARAFEQVGPKVEEFPYIDDRGSIGIGFMHAYLSSQLQVNRNNALPGTFIDFEKDLGLEGDQIRFFADLMYRVSPVSSFRLLYVDISRTGTRTLDRDITIGDRTYSVNAVLDVSLTTRYYLLAYRYSFVRNSIVEFGASAGFNIGDISSNLQLDTALNSPQIVQGNTRSKSENFIIPVPLVGIYFNTQVLPKAVLRNSILYFDASIGEYSLKSLNYMITLEYIPWPNIALGVGAYTNRVQVDKGAGFDGKFLSIINSSTVYAKYYF